MALSDANKAKIRRYLGYPDVSRSSFPDVEGAMSLLSTEGEAEVTTVLGSLATIDSTLTSSWSRQKVIKAEEVTLAGADEILALRAEGSRLVGMLASLLGVRVRANAFSSGGNRSGIMPRG